MPQTHYTEDMQRRLVSGVSTDLLMKFHLEPPNTKEPAFAESNIRLHRLIKEELIKRGVVQDVPVTE